MSAPTWRDELAARAMQGMLSSDALWDAATDTVVKGECESASHYFASRAYMYADAMLAEAERRADEKEAGDEAAREALDKEIDRLADE